METVVMTYFLYYSEDSQGREEIYRGGSDFFSFA